MAVLMDGAIAGADTLPVSPPKLPLSKDEFDEGVETILKNILQKELNAGQNGQKILACAITGDDNNAAQVTRLSLSAEGTLKDYGADILHDSHGRRTDSDWNPVDDAIVNGLLPIDFKQMKVDESHSEWNTINAISSLHDKLLIFDNTLINAFVEYDDEETLTALLGDSE